MVSVMAVTGALRAGRCGSALFQRDSGDLTLVIVLTRCEMPEHVPYRPPCARDARCQSASPSPERNASNRPASVSSRVKGSSPASSRSSVTPPRSPATATQAPPGATDNIEPAEFTYPSGLSVHEHVHAGADEMFYLLGGELTGFCEEDRWTATAGSFVFVPRDRPHGFTVTSAGPAKALVITGPPQLDRQIAARGEPATGA
jgi:quercetin dioxygenase-like cupin family protein